MLGQFDSTSVTTSRNSAVEKHVRFRQQQAAEAHDRRTRATPTRITAGDWVRISLPRRSHKMAPTYSDPRQVARVHGNCVTLCNGQRWNLRHCLHHRPSLRGPPSHSMNQSAAQSATVVARQELPTSPSDAAEVEDDAAYFTFPAAPTNVAVQPRQAVTPPNVQPVGPRRSKRTRRPKDFSSFITN